MEKFSNFFSMLTNTGADLQLDEIFIIVFVSLVVLALLLGYLIGRKVSNKGDKKQKKAEKKLAKEQAKEDKEAAKLEKAEAKEAAKAEKKAKKNKDKPDDWFDADSNDDDKPSSMPIIPERTTTTFIDTNSESRVESRPVVSAPAKRQKQQPTSPKHAAASKAELKQRAQAEADARKAEEERQKSVDREEQRAAAVAAALQAKASQSAEEEQPEEPKLSKREQKKLEKEQAKLEKEQAKAAKEAEPKLSKKEQKKLKKAEEEGLANTVIVEAAQTDSTVTAEEMAKRLESIMGTTPTGTVSLGAAEEEEVPADQIGTIQATQIEGRHNDNWVLEEAQRQNAEADKKEAERKERDALPFTFGSDIEGSADDVQLSYKARKKLREEEDRKAQEEEQKKERKHIASIFAKKQEEEAVVEEEEDFFDENYMGEEIPDSLAGFGFSAAPMLNNDDEKPNE